MQVAIAISCNGPTAGLRLQTAMSTVILSDNLEVIIPPEIHEALHLKAGETLRVIASEGHVELAPIRPIQSMRGFLRGMDSDIERDEDRL